MGNCIEAVTATRWLFLPLMKPSASSHDTSLMEPFTHRQKALSASSYVLEAGEQRCLVAIIDKSMPSCGYPYDGSGHGSGNTELRESLDDRIL